MKLNQNSKIRFQIIFISIFGGLGFTCYLAFSMYSSLNIERNTQDVKEVQYPVIQRLVRMNYEVVLIRDSLSDVVGLGNEIFIEDADELVEDFHRLVSEIVAIDPDFAKKVGPTEELLDVYYKDARALTLMLVRSPDDLNRYEPQATLSNERFKILNTKIADLLAVEQNDFTSSLSDITTSIQSTLRIGVYLAVLTLVGIFIVTWRALVNILRLINRSDSLKKEFLATMSHELRTPMNGIYGAMQLLRMTSLDEEQVKYLDVAGDSFSSMKMSVDDILTFSDFMSEKPKIRKVFVDLSRELKGFLDEVNEHADKKNLALKVDLRGCSEFLVETDAQKILHVVRHVLNNALKFTAEGTIEFKMEYRVNRSLLEAGIVEISVKDSGRGIPEDKLEDVFQPFKQLDGSFHRLHQGIGLGLAMCRAISDSMSGVIGLKNREDTNGVVVTYSFPAKFKRHEVHDNLSKGKLGAEIKLKVAKNEIILVAEDNNVNQLVIKGLLKRLGYQVVLADNGQEALDKLQGSNITLVLMDCQMPVMDGFESTKCIRELDEPYCDIPIIAVTANTMEGDREHCLEVGMNEYLKKPVNIGVLKKAIEEQLEKVC
ncbi:hypothetical protein A9Q81_13725 [Gammaproteobacteria bacterium 42_54_T18]|nr:hypothetical protein A9Q81_13725 [Gammaproteobacteria bacterium 42_54_T18]